MRLENIIKSLVPAVFAVNTAYAANASDSSKDNAAKGRNATEDQIATKKQIDSVIKINDSVKNYKGNQKNLDDWKKQKALIENKVVAALIKPVRDKPGYCNIGLDGFPQKYDLPADPRTKDGTLEKSEMILNLSENDPANKFYFPCDLKAKKEKPIIVRVPGPKIEKEVAKGTFSVGAGYLHIFTPDDVDSQYGFNGNLMGGNFFVTYQPRKTNWYFGGELSGYGNSSSASQNFTAAATEGPLAGDLTLEGSNKYSLDQFGIGAGAIGGYQFLFDKDFGLGLELRLGVMHDWTKRNLKERTYSFINGNYLEGSVALNQSSSSQSEFSMFAALGARIKLHQFCIIPSIGIKPGADFGKPGLMLSLDFAYCP